MSVGESKVTVADDPRGEPERRKRRTRGGGREQTGGVGGGEPDPTPPPTPEEKHRSGGGQEGPSGPQADPSEGTTKEGDGAEDGAGLGLKVEPPEPGHGTEP